MPFLSHIDGGLMVCICGHVREWHHAADDGCTALHTVTGSTAYTVCDCREYDEGDE